MKLACHFIAITLCTCGLVLTAGCASQATNQDVGAPEAPDSEGKPELATYMSQLQYYSHKLMLSAHAENAPLTGFYLHELEETAEEVEEQVPEYEGHAIGELVGAMLMPKVEDVEGPLEEKDWAEVSRRLDALVEACNACHGATDHGFIEITRTSENPYSQEF